LPSRKLAQVPDRRVRRGHTVHMGVDQHLVISPVDRVVQDRPVEPELPAARSGRYSASALRILAAIASPTPSSSPRSVTTWLSGSPSRIRTRTPELALSLRIFCTPASSDKNSPAYTSTTISRSASENRCPHVSRGTADRCGHTATISLSDTAAISSLPRASGQM